MLCSRTVVAVAALCVGSLHASAGVVSLKFEGVLTSVSGTVPTGLAPGGAFEVEVLFRNDLSNTSRVDGMGWYVGAGGGQGLRVSAGGRTFGTVAGGEVNLLVVDSVSPLGYPGSDGSSDYLWAFSSGGSASGAARIGLEFVDLTGNMLGGTGLSKWVPRRSAFGGSRLELLFDDGSKAVGVVERAVGASSSWTPTNVPGPGAAAVGSFIVMSAGRRRRRVRLADDARGFSGS